LIRAKPRNFGEVSVGRGESGLHRLGKSVRGRQRPDHHGQLSNEAIVTETQEIEPVELPIADPGFEDQRRGVAAVEPLDVLEVLEHLHDGMQDARDRFAAFVGLEDDRATEDDVGREAGDDRRGAPGLDRFLKGLRADGEWRISIA
jgi:hypothetical protein